ncbi:tRNA glutamyl-Q(34) synthetase GluQRS [Wenxinia marina]|uniref:Glutamyl-and glutaminyl-tRNA synthetase n=1 Tax=Wenxinia marina DSM 24838 TaxID=1123501 RepID=A0A0D0QCS0_9RHOB|nr:tRNA glutamyl-Q(34) synthetase GluQRS [Wenxinia marina]KIQ68743.1 Glutamyl- and glutaminyl-tRNA synthetase [Wenxinia marina DSM 24838]GGL65520.1 tRNA glutamyl-Q synthetase [Wenxinia marina]
MSAAPAGPRGAPDVRTRFAPSPTGPLHLGHAFSALTAAQLAEKAGGTFLLRIEDIDRQRSKPEWEQRIYDDLRWLGLEWPEPVLRQSERMAAYDDALELLWRAGLLYPCSCSRADIYQAASAPQEGAPLTGPDGIVYPGTCRPADAPARRTDRRPGGALRLDMARAAGRLGDMPYMETGEGGPRSVAGPAAMMVERIGDVVLQRRDFGTSYHLAVVVDDAAQGVTLVTRGADLAEATPIHVLLQRLLGLPLPWYHHHRLIRDETGRRLAKRDDARAISRYRAEGATPENIRRMVGLA